MQQQAAADKLRHALGQRDRIDVIAFDDRVVFDDQPLPDAHQLAHGLFRRLRQRGVECLGFTRGVTGDELTRLLDQLHMGYEGELAPGAHVALGFIADAGEGDPAADRALPLKRASVRTLVGLNPRQQAGSLQQLWQQVYRGDQSAPGALTDIVTDICTTVSHNRNAMLPLASLKSHDEYTYVHTINVAILAAALAEAVGLRSDDVHDVTIAALMHDIGKRRVPKRLLNKSDKFTDDEWRIVRGHPTEGARLLFNLGGLPEIAPIVAFEHHMHIDGTGYPRVPAGWRMHLSSQIVQVADVFDALRTDRPYRQALSLEEAMDVLLNDAGTSLDRCLVDVFTEHVARNTERDFQQVMGINAVKRAG
jgi:putative nucleotidyltransferase with HDIG domain